MKTFKAFLIQFVKDIVLVFVGTVSGIMLLTLAYMVPVNNEKIEQSLELIELEGWYPRADINTNKYASGDYWESLYPDVMMGFPDEMNYEIAVGDETKSPLYNAINVGDYSRYWQGFVVYLRPLLYFFDHSEIRQINLFLQLLLVFLTFIAIYIYFGTIKHPLLFFSTWLLMYPSAMYKCLAYSPHFYVAVIGTLYIIRHRKYLESNGRVYSFFVILGMCSVFFPRISTPMLAWGIPASWWLLSEKIDCHTCDENSIAFKRVKELIGIAFSWLVGYAGLWVCKWIASDLLFGIDSFTSASEEAQIWSAGKSDDGITSISGRFEVIYKLWRHYGYYLFLAVLLIWAVYLFYSFIMGKVKVRRYNLVWVIMILSSPAYFLVMATHSIGHQVFTYRSFLASIAAGLAFIVEVNCSSKERTDHIKVYIKRVILSAMCLVPGIVICMQPMDELWRHNGGSVNYEYPIRNEDVIEMSFIPAFGRIMDIQNCIKSDNDAGYYDYQIYDGEDLLINEMVPFTVHSEYTFTDIGISANLKKEHIYSVKIVPHDMTGVGKISLTLPGDLSFNEFGEATINGVKTQSQIIAGFDYKVHPLERNQQLHLIFTFAVITFMILSVTYSFTKKTKETKKQ